MNKLSVKSSLINLLYSFPFRLVGGLTSENVRWAESVKRFREEETQLTGNVLMITGMKDLY